MVVMQLMRLLLLYLGIGICWASPTGRRFLMMFPHHNDHGPDVGRGITITASASWTSVTVQVLNSTFKEDLFLSAGQSKTVPLPSVVEMSSPRSSNLLSVVSREPVSVLASFCTPKGCDHSLLHEVFSWGTHYYPVTPKFPDQSSVSQVVITNSDQETSVDVVLSGNVVFEGNLHPMSSVLNIHLAALESVLIQSNDSLSGAEILSQKPVGVIVGYTCSEKTNGNCIYGFSDLEPISQLGLDYVIPPLTECGIHNGRRACPPPAPVAGKCTFIGGRHIKTYDGHSFDLHMGSCVYILSQMSLMNRSDVAHIQQDQLHLRLHGVNLTLDWEQKGSVEVNGVSWKLPVLLGNISVMQSGLSTRVETQSGMVFTYNGSDAIQIIVPASYRGKLHGLCGNFNGDPTDDARTPHGNSASDGRSLAISWAVSNSGTNCSQGCFYQGRYHKLGEVSWAKACWERCNCSAPATMHCKPASCPVGTRCSLINGSLGCVGKALGLASCSENKGPCGAPKQSMPPQCWVLGGPHYHTFDGQAFEFQGNGTYTLVQNCDNASEPFWVRVQNHCAKNRASTLKAVHMIVYQDHIMIQKGDKGRVWVNGHRRLLPVILHSGLLRIHQRGLFAVMETGYGVQVKYDWSHYALVTLSSNHTDVCGLCGNSNGDTDDDLRTPGGAVANATAFGWSWRLPDQEDGGPCPSHPTDQLQNDVVSIYPYGVSKIDFLWSEQNPLHQCHSVVYPTLYSAVYTNAQEVLCPVLQAYGASCQDAGVQVGSWRNSTFCPSLCPANSHYESCGSACPASCEHLFSSAPCTLACMETCQCDPGFVLEGDACVPVTQCGCVHKGFLHHGGQAFWADESCTTRCVCDRRAVCHTASCGPDQYCGLQDGITTCLEYPWQTCRYSDGHFSTFDQHVYNLWGDCRYQLLGMSGQKPDLIPIEVHIQTDGHLDSVLHVLVKVNGTLVKMNSKDNERVEVNGVMRNMPYLMNSTFLVHSAGLHSYIFTDLGFSLTLSASKVMIALSERYTNATRGLCGNFNGDPADDLRAADSMNPLSPEQFGRAWRSGDDPWCAEGSLGNSSSQQLDLYSDAGACGKILEVNGPFRDCHGQVEPTTFYTNCVSDLRLGPELRPDLCSSLAEYADVCRLRGATVHAWRSPSFCHHTCPPGYCYTPSSTASTLHCLGRLKSTLELPSTPGENCRCEPGLVLSGALCVLPENCGCFHQGEYMRAGQEMSTCQQSCACHAGGHLTYRNISCSEEEECVVHHGVQHCQPRPKEAHCAVDGRSRYTSFDGQAFEFHGSCNYTLAKTCSVTLKEKAVEAFVVVVQGSQEKGREIYLQVKGMNITLSNKHRGKVNVGGVLENLPFFSSGVTVMQTGHLVTVQALGSVQLSSDLHNHVLVKVPYSYRHATCGLCGNYNGDPSDDLQLPNRTLTSDPEAFGESWRQSDAGANCSDRWVGDGHLCHSLAPKYSSSLFCGHLTLPHGPFAPCHPVVHPRRYYSSCMADLCAEERPGQPLCDALQAYEVACRVKGVKVDPWRSNTGCAYQCPQFSHYQRCANACSLLCPEVGQAVQCPVGCEEGCQCDPGYFYNGHACVPDGKCGCEKDGRRFEASESRLLENCSTKCRCGPPLVCEFHACPAHHACTLQDGVMGCQKTDPCKGRCGHSAKCVLRHGVGHCEIRQSLCWTWGDSHYHTFDGLDFDLEGSCAYLLAASQHRSSLNPFKVTVRNSRRSGASAGSVRVVTVIVYGMNVTLARAKVQVDNLFISTLPLGLLGGRLQVMRWEEGVLLKTDFGLQVFYGRDSSTLTVTLVRFYRGKVRGLCGNFNGDPKDDKSSAKTVADWARVYRVSDGDPRCCTYCKDKPPLQNWAPTPENGAEFVSDNSQKCAALMDKKGRFGNCNVDAKSFYKVCVSDLARNAGAKIFMDQAMHSYSSICGQSEYVYTSTSTDLICPSNSHYESCGTACPESCQSKPRFCIKMCVQGCFCDPGFVRSPEGCIRPEQCGCTDTGGSYHGPGATFWTTEDCGQKCVCEPAGRRIRCSPTPCPRGQVCRQLVDRRTCQPSDPFNCTLMGGLHFITFDGHSFDFRDACTYTLVETSSSHAELTPFKVTISDARCNNRLFHSMDLQLSVYGVEVAVRKNDPAKVLVDGLRKPLPYSHQTGYVSAYRTPSSLVIHADFDLQVVLYRTGTIVVVLPATYHSAVRGLCGNANANPFDDQRTADGRQVRSAAEFARSWAVGAAACGPGCSSGLKRCGSEELVLFEDADFCGLLLNELGPFEECAAALSPRAYFHGCTADACAYGGHHAALCAAVESYATACQAARLPVSHWRSDTFCGAACPRNSHYELCGPRCPVTCAGRSAPSDCSGGCQEGCQCDPGYVLSDDRCVPASDCGCLYDGQYYPAGDFYPGNQDQCRKCHCEGGEASCLTSACGRQETCSVEDGVAMCRPVAYGVCHVFAGFGYITFDGLVLPNHGACTYILSALSSKAGYNHTLLLHFEKDRKGTPRMSRLEFRLDGFELAVDPETLWKVQFNREDFSLPFETRGNITAFQDGGSLVITMFGVRIELSPTQHLLLKVPQDNNSTASGLCGNFNGDPSDDLELRSGRLANSPAEFLRGWAATPPGQSCQEDCGGVCDRCTAPPEAPLACGVLMTSNGVFGDCRLQVDPQPYKEACVMAVCAGDGYMEAVCLALEAYAGACRSLGATVGPWRVNTSCALQCPDRSSPSECVESSSVSCSTLLHPHSTGPRPPGCSDTCQCLHGSILDGDQCVPYSRCGCVHRGRYIQMDEELYSGDCTERCRCHPRGGALCEPTSCPPGKGCGLRDGAWGCRERPGVCELRGGLRVTSLSGVQLSLEPLTSYALVSLCDRASELWFNLVSFHGPCGDDDSRNVTVLQIFLPKASIAIQEGSVKVDGHPVSLPHSLSSGASLSLGATQQRSEVTVVLRRDPGAESELEVEVGVSVATVRLPLWYAGKLCGLCVYQNAPPSEKPVLAQVLPDFPGCGIHGGRDN